MDTPPPPDTQWEQQRHSLMTKMSPAVAQQETALVNTPTSAPSSARDEFIHPLEQRLSERSPANNESSGSPGGFSPTLKRKNTTVKFIEPQLPLRDVLKDTLPIPDLAPKVRLSKGQTNAYLRRLEGLGNTLRSHRTGLSRARAVLAHQESIEKSKHEYLQESNNLICGMLLKWHDRSSKDELQLCQNTLQSDKIAYDNQVAEVRYHREEVSKRQSAMQHIEARLDKLLLKLRHRLVDDDDDQLSIISDESRHSLQQDNTPLPVAGEIDQLLDRIGDRRMIIEEFLEVETDRNEEHDRWELLTEQDRPVSPGYAQRTDATYSARQEELRDALRQADDAVMVAYERCLLLNLNPDQYITDSRLTGRDNGSESSEDPTGESSGIYVGTEPTTHNTGSEAAIFESAQSSRQGMLNPLILSPRAKSPSPQGSQRIEKWLNTVRTQGGDETPVDVLVVDTTGRVSRPVSATEQTLDGASLDLQLREERQKAAAHSALDEVLAGIATPDRSGRQSPQMDGHTEGSAQEAKLRSRSV